MAAPRRRRTRSTVIACGDVPTAEGARLGAAGDCAEAAGAIPSVAWNKRRRLPARPRPGRRARDACRSAPRPNPVTPNTPEPVRPIVRAVTRHQRRPDGGRPLAPPWIGGGASALPSEAVRFGRVLCAKCNNQRSQPLDRAYEVFSDYLATNIDIFWRADGIDFRRVYGGPWLHDSPRRVLPGRRRRRPLVGRT